MTDQRRNVYFFHKQDQETNEQARSLTQLAEEHGFTVVNQHSDANIIASIGGDGTFLQAVRKTNFRDDCLYVGITKKGKAHLYCDFHSDEREKMVDAMTFEQIEVRKYPLIEVTVDQASP